MGFISRRVLPACGNMCVCCPALRPSSRRPVKRYKKLLGEIFPKSVDGHPNERKILKLCEYAVKNPFRIPKIAKLLEQRSHKELRCEHINFIKIIMEVYSKLLCICKEQIAYFAVNLLNVVIELLDYKRQDTMRILGCQTLTTFIYSQAGNTYARSIESLVRKVCMLARKEGEEYTKHCLRAASLQCLSAMVWFMTEFSHFFADFDEIVHVTLDNYMDSAMADERRETNHNWVDEVVRCEARGLSGVGSAVSPSNSCLQPQLKIKDLSLLTIEESETPKVWAQICIQKIVEMAKESTTMRRILDPMLIYFDTGKHWAPQQGLAMIVFSDIWYLVKSSGKDQVILATIVRHLDHKNVVNDPQIKSEMIHVVSGLLQQPQTLVAVVGVVSDLCRHLRKSLQATVELVGPQESNRNVLLQNSIEGCLLEIAKRIGNARPLFGMMARTLEELPENANVARATIGSLLILAHTITLASINSHSQLVFPDDLLLQLLKTMVHPDVETRIGAHRIFAVLLVRIQSHQRHDSVTFQSEYLYDPRKWQSKTTSAFASATALFEKLRREKEFMNADEQRSGARVDMKEKEMVDEEGKNSWAHKSSPNFCKIGCSIIDRTTSSIQAEHNIAILNEDQISQLLSAFWVQANQPDNMPSNFEAIARSFSLMLLSARMKDANHNNVVRCFQLPLSLRKVALNTDDILPPACLRSLFTLATGMLSFAGKIYHFRGLSDSIKLSISKDVDPYLGIGDDLQLYVRPQADLKDYGSDFDQEAATSLLTNLRETVAEYEQYLLDSIVQCLCDLTDMELGSLSKQLSETFMPEDGLLFGPNSHFDWVYVRSAGQSEESLSFEEEFSKSSSIDDTISESPAPDLPLFALKMPSLPTFPHLITVGQLLESALQVAGQVAGTAISTSPLPYGQMTSQCEALGMVSRKKMSSWLSGSSQDLIPGKTPHSFLASKPSAIGKMKVDETEQEEAFTPVLRLPPASPFDNFMKAAQL